MQNWCYLASSYIVIADQIKLPLNEDVFTDYCKNKGIHWSNQLRNSDMLSEFWNSINFMVDQNLIINGWDYKVEVVNSISIRNSKTKTDELIPFAVPTRIVFFRLNNIHKHYQTQVRSRTGTMGLTMDNLQHYFASRKYYIGSIKNKQFKRIVEDNNVLETTTLTGVENKAVYGRKWEKIITSCYAFTYDQLPLDIDRGDLED
jgi:hypothetical protein